MYKNILVLYMIIESNNLNNWLVYRVLSGETYKIPIYIFWCENHCVYEDGSNCLKKNK